jgi:predicted small lipoprotein YifL
MDRIGRRHGWIAFGAALAALLMLAGCGKRGDLDAPLGQVDTSKRVYPAQ